MSIKKFKIQDITNVAMVNIYEVEATSEQEALELYINELAGSLECIDHFIRETLGKDEESIKILK